VNARLYWKSKTSTASERAAPPLHEHTAFTVLKRHQLKASCQTPRLARTLRFVRAHATRQTSASGQLYPPRSHATLPVVAGWSEGHRSLPQIQEQNMLGSVPPTKACQKAMQAYKPAASIQGFFVTLATAAAAAHDHLPTQPSGCVLDDMQSGHGQGCARAVQGNTPALPHCSSCKRGTAAGAHSPDSLHRHVASAYVPNGCLKHTVTHPCCRKLNTPRSKCKQWLHPATPGLGMAALLCQQAHRETSPRRRGLTSADGGQARPQLAAANQQRHAGVWG
jgi:hypothetical protein